MPHGTKMAETLEGKLKDGKQDGFWTAWHENGQKMSEEQFKDGKEVVVKWWFDNGQQSVKAFTDKVSWKVLIRTGIPPGNKIEAKLEGWRSAWACDLWYENGQKREERKYKHGKPFCPCMETKRREVPLTILNDGQGIWFFTAIKERNFVFSYLDGIMITDSPSKRIFP